MNIKSTTAALKFSVTGFLLFSFVFADEIWWKSHGFSASIIRKITAIFHDPATQWMAVTGLALCFIVFLFLERHAVFLSSMPTGIGRLNALETTSRLRRIYVCCRNAFLNPNLWLTALVALVLLRYAFAYQTASNSLRVSVLLVGIVFGKVISALIRRQNNHIEQDTFWSVSLLIWFLACAALWQPKPMIAYQYHGVTRWSGVWDNPNLYGLLMGFGLVLAMGIGIREWRTATGRWRKSLGLIFCLIAAILTGYGLFKSYSRGAWLGTLLGLIYLAVQAGKPSRFSAYLSRNRLPLVLLVASLSLLIFWQFRFSESLLAQRLFSVTNANDFSWRNRVTAWEGAIHMMIDRPLDGVGWGSATSSYQKKYLPPQLKAPGAIQTDDFFMLGISAGVSALFCFVAYLALSFRKRPAGLSPPFSIFTVCRSGSIVLLVGFWFDGGLFELPVTTVFWMLMELSRIEPEVKSQKSEVRSQPDSLEIRNPKSEIRTSHWLRRAAWILAAVALLQTAVYLVTPFLPVSRETLAIARKCLASPKEINDFDFLSTNMDWRGKKLKILLEHVDLANYNRQIINWQLDDKIYRDYVLSPIITGNSGEQLNWRRPLWEEFYPRISHESSPEDAAKIVMRHLRERVIIAATPNLPHDVPDIWLKKITDESGFEIIYVAALRSVGVPARLNHQWQAELFADGRWQLAPRPVVSTQ